MIGSLPGGEGRGGRRRYSVASMRCAIEAVLLAGMCVLLAQTLRPGFGGGRFVLFVLVFNVALLSMVLLRDLASALRPHRAVPAGATETANPHLPIETDLAANWPTVARCLGLIVGYFALVLVFGCVVGMSASCWAVLRFHVGLKPVRATLGALVLGAFVPIGFSLALGVLLWPGVLPEAIPGWLGGGILPGL